MLADEVDYVVGVDTHRDAHVLAIVVAPAGRIVAQRSVRASRRGYTEAVRFAEAHARGIRVWAIEGAGHYGAGLAGHLSGQGETVLEVARGPRDERRLRGKDDPLDAIRAARAVLASETPTLPRSGQRREALRLLLIARRSAVDVRRQALVQLRSVIVTPPTVSGPSCVDYQCGVSSSVAAACDARARVARMRSPQRSCCGRWHAASRRTAEAAELEREILAHVRVFAPQLLSEHGVGPIVAAQMIIAWSHPGRVRSEAAFARLAGVAPIPASTGQTVRHRLSRGGDRQLNRALHTVILHRRQHDPTTKAYIARRVSEGKSPRDAVRLLKRYLARHLYRVLHNPTPLPT